MNSMFLIGWCWIITDNAILSILLINFPFTVGLICSFFLSPAIFTFPFFHKSVVTLCGVEVFGLIVLLTLSQITQWINVYWRIMYLYIKYNLHYRALNSHMKSSVLWVIYLCLIQMMNNLDRSYFRINCLSQVAAVMYYQVSVSFVLYQMSGSCSFLKSDWGLWSPSRRWVIDNCGVLLCGWQLLCLAGGWHCGVLLGGWRCGPCGVLLVVDSQGRSAAILMMKLQDPHPIEAPNRGLCLTTFLKSEVLN